MSEVATAILSGDSHQSMHPSVQLDPSRDNTERLQGALNLTGKEGGGTVLLPAGVWPISASLRLPDNVTLRGVSTTASVLRRLEGDGPCIEFGKREGTLGEGCAIESLTLDGKSRGGEPTSCGVLINGDAAYGIVRHVKISNMNGDGIRCEGGSINCLYLEGISIESCLGSSIYLQPDRSSSGIFLSDISVKNANPIKSSRPCAVWLRGRCMISQLQVDLVQLGHVGVFFDEGSDFSLVSGLYVGGHHDETVVMAPGVKNVPLSNIITRRGPQNLVPKQLGS
ncbi:hypothetical protein [Reyranella sp.]|uniref:hypothetical protein n=1 Tax=Reyranella sp. TaxID=1929291 RepID=UPI003D0C07CE